MIVEDVLISIVIPVYNVEEYLHECINSVIGQEYYNLEIILVDDGSTDLSGQICDEYARIDKRIKVIHKENGGLSDARNAGLEIVTGEYVGFVDSDDVISSNMYATLLENIIEENADIALCTYLEFDKTPFLECAVQSNALKKKFCSKDFLKVYICGSEQYKITPSVWTRLYKRELIQGMKFPKGRCFEDLVWSAQVIFDAGKIVYIDIPLYFYRRRESSITNLNNHHGLNEKILTDRVYEHKRLYEKLLDLNCLELADEARYVYVRMLMEYYRTIKIYNIDEFKHHLNGMRQALNKEKKWLKYACRKNKGRRRNVLILILLSPDIYVLMWKVKSICVKVREKGN